MYLPRDRTRRVRRASTHALVTGHVRVPSERMDRCGPAPCCRTPVWGTARDGNRQRKNVTASPYTRAGDGGHVHRVSKRKLGVVAYRVMRQHVREVYLLLPCLRSRLFGEKSCPTTDVRRCLLREDTTIRQTSRKAGTQSPEATARRTAPCQSSRRTVHWRSTDASDAPARACRRHYLHAQRVQRE